MSCKKYLRKNKMSKKAQVNNSWLCPRIEELDCLCPIELLLISQVILFIIIVAKVNGAQHCLKGYCFLVLADLKRIHTVLPRSCDDEYIISIALKRRLNDKSVVNKQHFKTICSKNSTEKISRD